MSPSPEFEPLNYTFSDRHATRITNGLARLTILYLGGTASFSSYYIIFIGEGQDTYHRFATILK